MIYCINGYTEIEQHKQGDSTWQATELERCAQNTVYNQLETSLHLVSDETIRKSIIDLWPKVPKDMVPWTLMNSFVFEQRVCYWQRILHRSLIKYHCSGTDMRGHSSPSRPFSITSMSAEVPEGTCSTFSKNAEYSKLLFGAYEQSDFPSWDSKSHRDNHLAH